VQEGGRWAVGKGELGGARGHCGGARRAHAALPCCPDALAATEAVDKLSLGARHTARRRLRRAGLWRSREPGSLEPGAMAQRALRTPSPLLLRRERVVVGAWPWLWAAHPREAMEERGCREVPRQLGKLPSVISVFWYFLLDPAAKGPMPLLKVKVSVKFDLLATVRVTM
jgi:hypothetical protein